jgi:Co/Zn/Cd efflux system component
MLVSTTVLLTIVSAVFIGVASGYVVIWSILRLFGRRQTQADTAPPPIATAAHASGD